MYTMGKLLPLDITDVKTVTICIFKSLKMYNFALYYLSFTYLGSVSKTRLVYLRFQKQQRQNCQVFDFNQSRYLQRAHIMASCFRNS